MRTIETGAREVAGTERARWTQWTKHVLAVSARKFSWRKDLDEVDEVDEGFGPSNAGPDFGNHKWGMEDHTPQARSLTVAAPTPETRSARGVA